MQRREFLSGLASGTAAVAAAAQSTGQERPNILHIQTDQQQWATLAGRSDCRTPNLNRLAEQGMLFERSYTPSAVCCPSRAMTLSGAYHWHNGVYNQVHSAPSVKRDLNADTVLYSQRLKDAGYRLGYIGKWHCSWVRTPADFGYGDLANVFGCDPRALAKLDLNPDHVQRVQPQRPKPARMFQWPGSDPFMMWGRVDGPEEATAEAYSTECALRMLKRFTSDTSRPWLMEVQYVQPHDPYSPLGKYLDRYDPRSIKVPRSFQDTFHNKPGLHKRESQTWGSITEDDYRNGRAHYYAYTEQLDAQIGRVLKALDDSGQADKTMVVFTTDHGDMVGSHRMWIKGWIPYEECYRVPLIIRWPGKVKAGAKSDRLVQLQDLAHTYVDVAGAKALPHADGASMKPLFDNPQNASWRDQIMCAYYGGEFLYTQRIAITDRYKYVFNGFDQDEMYDLQRDPEEMTNVVDETEYKPRVDDMRARLYEMMRQYSDPYGDTKGRDASGVATDRYGARRYLPSGKRMA